MISVVYGSVEVEDGTNGRHDRYVQPSKLQLVELSCASELNRIVLQGVVAYHCCLGGLQSSEHEDKHFGTVGVLWE